MTSFCFLEKVCFRVRIKIRARVGLGLKLAEIVSVKRLFGQTSIRSNVYSGKRLFGQVH